MQLSNYFCVNEKYVLDEPVRYPQCLVLCLRDKLSLPRQCVYLFLLFIVLRVENPSSDKYDVKNCNFLIEIQKASRDNSFI